MDLQTIYYLLVVGFEFYENGIAIYNIYSLNCFLNLMFLRFIYVLTHSCSSFSVLPSIPLYEYTVYPLFPQCKFW